MINYTKDLYKNIIEEPANYFNNLKIVSGYASSRFLKRVIKDFPNHRILLIIGMASQGISLIDHGEFKKICRDLNTVNVFYKDESPANHMKIYQWYNDEKPGIAFIGSANFSESGFFKQEEILLPSLECFSSLIDDILTQSISCLDDSVEAKIPLYEGTNYGVSESQAIVINETELSNNDIIKEDDSIFEKNKVDSKKFILHNNGLTPYNHITLELILKDNPHWQTRALNNWNRKFNAKNDSYIDIERTNRLGIKKLDFFPRDINFKLISDDNEEWIVKRAGQYGKELKTVTGLSFYEYFKQRLGIKEDRPISYEDFQNYGRTNISLYKINDDEYLLDFSLDS